MAEINLPDPPDLSLVGRRVLAEADERDAVLRDEIGMDWPDACEYLAGLSTPERAQLMHDGLKWRHHCHTLDRRRAQVMASHAISAGLDWREFGTHYMPYALRYAPSREYLDRVARAGEYTGGPVQWATGRPSDEYERREAA